MNQLKSLISNIKYLLSKIQFPSWSIPIVLLIETLVAYGLLAAFQGFYFDDWQMVWLLESGTNFWEFYAYDRPFSAWTLYVFGPILGTSRIGWHIFTITLRWLVSWSIWWVMILIWPKKQRLITLIVMLFAVYPAFLHQPISVAYSQHFLTYVFFLLSFGFMLKSLGAVKGKFWIFSILGLIAQAVHLFTMEYFWGLEFVRILGIYFFFAQREDLTFRNALPRVIKRWMPYLLIFASAIFWRLFIYSPVEDPNELRLLAMFLKEPVAAALHFLEMILRDSLHMLIKAWEKTLQVGLIDLQDKFLVLVWIISALLSLGLVFFMRHFKWAKSEEFSWRKQMTLFGLAIMVLGPLPVWVTNKQITIGLYSDRFALAGMFGAAILLVVFLDRVLSTKLQVLVAVAVLAGLATGLHVRTGNDFRWAWTIQQRFYWQMHWRVPDLEPETAIFSDGAIFQYTGDYPTAFALNLLFSPGQQEGVHLPYWFFELDRGFDRYAGHYLNGQVMEDQLRNASFEGWSLDGLVIDYNPREGNCLWVVGPGDEAIYSLPGITLKALPLSDLSRIETDSTNKPNALFGSEPARTWCYYFQKAELARQIGDWPEVSQLADQVINRNFDPQNRFEWRPFVAGYLHTENYQGAYDLTVAAYQSEETVRDLFCSMWIERAGEAANDPELLEYAEMIEDELRCKW